MTENQVDVAVIGGGIVGSAAAYFLARRGARVALVERDRLGQGTTARSFAWINASSKIADEPYHRLNALGASIYHELADKVHHQLEEVLPRVELAYDVVSTLRYAVCELMVDSV